MFSEFGETHQVSLTSEFLGAAIDFIDSAPGEVAGLSISAGRKDKRVELIAETSRPESAYMATMQKPAGQLRFSQRTVTGRFGRVLLKPPHRLSAGREGRLS